MSNVSVPPGVIETIVDVFGSQGASRGLQELAALHAGTDSRPPRLNERDPLAVALHKRGATK
jgi:hypothetical protein